MSMYTSFASAVFDLDQEEFTRYTEDQLCKLLEISQKNTDVGRAIHHIFKDKGINEDLLAKYDHKICQDLFLETKGDPEQTTALVNCIKEISIPMGYFDKPGQIWNKLANYRRYSREGTKPATKYTLERRLPLEKFAGAKGAVDVFVFGSVRYGDALDSSDVNLYFFGDVATAQKRKLAKEVNCPLNPGDGVNLQDFNQQLERIAQGSFEPSLYQIPWQNLVEGVFLIGRNRYIDLDKTTNMRGSVLKVADKNSLFSHLLAAELSSSLGKRMARR